MSEEQKAEVAEETAPVNNEPTNPPAVEEAENNASTEPEKSEEVTEEKTEEKVEEKVEEKPVETQEDFVEEVIKLEDLVEETEYPEEEMQTLTGFYERTMNAITENEIVNGRILDITDSDVIIDIGFKSEGIVPKEEFDNIAELKPGDEVEVFLETLEDRDGQLSLSRKKADFIRVWEKVVKQYENDEVIKGVIVRRIKGGMVVNIMGIDAFLPGSQIDVKPIRDFDSFLGMEKEFKIVKVNHVRKNIVVSSRVLIEKEMESQRGEILSTLEKGQKRKGTVKNITDFGVFIDLGGVDGLLHITDLSWGRVNHPSELVKLDEELEVMILDFNENKDRISLGLKQLQPHPWEKVDEKYPVGSKINGKVVSLTDYGAFIELEKGIEGLIHISEMSWSQHIKHPSQLLTVGQMVEAVVLNIQAEDKKISLGLKQLEPDPWDKIEEKYAVGSVHKGIVRNLTQFGAFVELEEGIDGLVHISDLSWTKKVRHPSEIVKRNDEIEVVVLGINREERRIALGHKQIDANPWDSFSENYSINTDTKGKVSRIIEKGIIVTLPLGVDGFIPNQHVGVPKGKKISEVYAKDDEIPVKVIEFDKENKKIVLSIVDYFKGKEKQEWDDYLSTHGVEKTTLGEVAKKVDSKEAEEAKEEEPKTEAPAEKEPVEETEAPIEEKKEAEEPKAEETEEKPKEEKKPKAKAKKKTAKKEEVKEEKAEEPAAEKAEKTADAEKKEDAKAEKKEDK
jgi:small subunit ribosomal protein S1